MLQYQIRQWYKNFKLKIKQTIEKTIIKHYPKLINNNDSDNKISLNDHLRTVYELKLVLSDLRDSTMYMMKDIVSLSEAVNALLKGHAIYNNRITSLEQSFKNLTNINY